MCFYNILEKVLCASFKPWSWPRYLSDSVVLDFTVNCYWLTSICSNDTDFNDTVNAKRGLYSLWIRRGRMVVGFTTTYAISAYHH